MTTPCVLELEGVPIPVWQAEFTQVVIVGGSDSGPGGPAAWGSITGNIASQADLMAALAAKANTATLAPVATSGAYAALTGRPMLGTAAAANLGDFAPTVHAHLAASISDSTPVGRALLTAVDAAAARAAIGVAAPAWGAITGTLSAQVDLSAALAGKLSAASNLGDLPNTAAARINLGLGSAAQSAASSFATAAQGGKADTALQPGAGLSAIDSAAANKLAGVQAGAQVNAVASVAGKTGAVTLAAGDISGLGALATKGAVAVADVSASGTPGAGTFLRGDGAWAVPPAGGGGGAAAWGGISGTLGDQADLAAALAAKANTSSLAAVATAGTYASLTGKPALGTAAASNIGDFATAAQGDKADSAVQPAGLAPYAKTADLPAVPTKTSQLTNDSGFGDVSNKVDKVAGKGLSTEDYTTADKTKLAGIAQAATANATDAQLRDRATHTGAQAIATVAGLPAALDAKQSLLVSGANIKTINGQSLLGAGDLVIAGGGGSGGPAVWADITGKPGLLGADGWASMVLPGRWSAAVSIGPPLETQAGTVTHPTPSNAGLRASTPRWALTGNGAADGGVAQYVGQNQALISASGSAAGGFTYRARFAITSSLPTQRGFVGVQGYLTSSQNAEPYNGPDNIGVAFAAGVDANYQMVCHPAYGALTKQDAGAGFAIGNANAVLEVTLKNAPGSGIVTWRLRNLNSGANASGAFTANLPAPTQALSHKHVMNNAGNTGVVSMELMSIYLGSYIQD